MHALGGRRGGGPLGLGAERFSKCGPGTSIPGQPTGGYKQGVSDLGPDIAVSQGVARALESDRGTAKLQPWTALICVGVGPQDTRTQTREGTRARAVLQIQATPGKIMASPRLQTTPNPDVVGMSNGEAQADGQHTGNLQTQSCWDRRWPWGPASRRPR